MKPTIELLTAIAREHLGISTLEPRYLDRLDFHDVAVWQVQAALKAAFDAGAAERVITSAALPARFDAYEIAPCRRFREDGERDRFYYELCTPEDADVWALYGTFPAKASRPSATSRVAISPNRSMLASQELLMADDADDILDSLFHGCALTAYLQIAAELNCWPPPAEATRRRAYDLYEEALAEKNRRKSAALLDLHLPATLELDRTIQNGADAMQKKTSPTRATYDGLTLAYEFFNRELFSGKLPACLLTMQRQKGAYGYFSGDRFAQLGDAADITDEIALNPAHFASRTPTQILSTLVHEMVHLWQHRDENAKPGRRGYHNKEWAKTMRAIGLIPTATGEPGGQETGEKMTHIIEAGGRFEKACSAFLARHPAMLYHDRAGEETGKKKVASKNKYTCPGCGLNAWAKPDVHLVCGECGEALEAEEPAEGED